MYNLNNKIITRIIEIIMHALILQDNKIIVIGNNNKISTSKIREITAIRKNKYK